MGAGLLESLYEQCLNHELIKKGYSVIRQLSVPVIYDTETFNTTLHLDLLVENCIIIELKAVEKTHPVHEAQLITYMKLLEKPQGLLINFFTDNISKSMKPLVNEFFSKLPE
jgi:GxxExxY protein